MNAPGHIDDLSRRIERLLIRPDAAPAEINRLCREAIEWRFAAVCVRPERVARCHELLRESGVGIAALFGWPLGDLATSDKCEAARQALDAGATEIDVVIRMGDLIEEKRNAVRDDLAAVVDAAKRQRPDAFVKAVIETVVLPDGCLVSACRCCAEAQADGIKTSFDMDPVGAVNVEQVRLLRRCAAPIKVIACGGIRDWPTTKAMLEAGAGRVATSSSISILREMRSMR